MKGKLIQLLLSVLFWLSLLFLSGDLKKILEKLKAKAPETEGEVTVGNVVFSDDGTTQTVTFNAVNGTKDDLVYDSQYDVYLRRGDQIIALNAETVFTEAVSEVIPAGETREISVCVTDCYKRLDAGSYRLVKVIGTLPVDVDFEVK